MMSSKRLGGIAAAVILSSAGAFASDLPTRKEPAAPIYQTPVSASGLYAGALVGGAFGGLTTSSGSGSQAAGFTTGTLLGYKWRYSPWSFGFEGDISSNSLRQKFGGAPPTQIDNVYSAHARARVGYTLGDFEPFIAGGFALTELAQSRQGPAEFDGASTRRPGWTIGAGVDANVSLPLIGPSVIRAEYLYDSLSKTTLNLNGVTTRTGGSEQYVRLGLLNYLGADKSYVPSAVVANWGGYYAGVLGSYSTARISSSGLGGSGAFDANGGSVGIFTGKNWLFGQGVLGFEGSTQFASIKGDGPQPLAATISYKDYFVSDIRGRAGWTFDRLMPYVAGGIAFDDSAQTNFATGDHRGAVLQYSATIGAGLEYMLTDRISVRGEYAYAHSLGTITTKLDAENCCSQTRESQTVRLGLGYYFH